jgi:hypothetical protein
MVQRLLFETILSYLLAIFGSTFFKKAEYAGKGWNKTQ